jgi:bifunctional non-homologous end joining protein LigD
MAPLIPELARDDVNGVFDGELVAFREGVPYFPLVTARMLHRHREIPMAFALFDVLALDGRPTTSLPYAKRRELLGDARPRRRLPVPAASLLRRALRGDVRAGARGVVAKRRDSLYRPGERGWVKVKNRAYWRFKDERQLAQSRRRRHLTI